jgi:hypothetical protein
MKKKFTPIKAVKNTSSNFLDIKDPFFQINFRLKELPNYSDTIWNTNAPRVFKIKPIGTHIGWSKNEN